MSFNVLDGGPGWFRICSATGLARVDITAADVVLVDASGAEVSHSVRDLSNFWIAFTPDMRGRAVRALNRTVFAVTGLLRGPTHLDDFTGRCLRVVAATRPGVRELHDLGPVWTAPPPRGLAHAARATIQTYGGHQELGLVVQHGEVVVSDIREYASVSKAVSARQARQRATSRIREYSKR